MGKRSFSAQAFTPTVTADAASLSGGWMSLGASASTAGLLVYEIYEAGEAAASEIGRAHV